MPERITAYLRNARGLTNEQRADLWDAFYQSEDRAGLTSALEGIEAPREVKAELWDMKGGEAVATPEPTAPEAPPSSGGSLGGVPGFLTGAGRAMGRGAASVAPYLDPVSLAAKTTRAAGQAVGAGTLPQTPVERMSAGVTGAPAMQPPAPGDPNAGVQRAGGMAGNLAMLLAGGKGAGAAARGVAGPVGRALSSPALWGVGAGAETFRRTGSPLAAAEAGATAYGAGKLGGAALSRAPGVLGRVGRLLGLRGRGGSPAPVAGGARPAAAPVQVPAAAPAAGPVQPGGARPLPGGLPHTPRAKVVGGSASSGGATTQPKPQTPIGQARGTEPSIVPRQTTVSDEAAQMRVSEGVLEGAKKLGYSREQTQAYTKAAREVMEAQLDGTLSFQTPSGAPSQLANKLVEKFGESMGLTSPYKAQKFIDGVLRMAGQATERRGLGMGIVQ